MSDSLPKSDRNSAATPAASPPTGQPLTIEQALANLRQCEDLGLRYYAAWWLGKFRVSQPEAIDALLMALDDEAERAPDGGYPLRRNAARALGKLGDLRAVPPLIASLDCPDFYVREAAAQSLGSLGDCRCVSALIKFLAGGVEAAQKVPGKPHLTQPYAAVLEALGSLRAVEAQSAIAPFLQHPVKRVQYSAARALYQLTAEAHYAETLVTALQDSDLRFRRAALIDLGATDYLPAAKAITKTLAENSIKLISLRGLLENHLGEDRPEPLTLSAEAIRLMNFMDDLL